MKHIINLALTLLLISMSVSATAQKPVSKTNYLLETLNERLKLSPEQYGKIEAFIEEQHSAIRSTRISDSSSEEKKDALKAARSTFKKNVESILEPAQLENYHLMQEEARAKRKASQVGSLKGDRKPKAEKRKALEKRGYSKKPSEEEKAARKAQMEKRRVEMEPKLRAMRADFDDQLKRRDRKKLSKLRPVFQAQKEMQKAKRAEMKKSGERPSKEEVKERLAGAKEELADEKAELKKLTEKYSEQINAAFAANPEVQKFMTEHHKPRGRFKMGRNNQGKQAESKRAEKMARLFLLMDPDKK